MPPTIPVDLPLVQESVEKHDRHILSDPEDSSSEHTFSGLTIKNLPHGRRTCFRPESIAHHQHEVNITRFRFGRDKASLDECPTQLSGLLRHPENLLQAPGNVTADRIEATKNDEDFIERCWMNPRW